MARARTAKRRRREGPRRQTVRYRVNDSNAVVHNFRTMNRRNQRIHLDQRRSYAIDKLMGQMDQYKGRDYSAISGTEAVRLVEMHYMLQMLQKYHAVYVCIRVPATNAPSSGALPVKDIYMTLDYPKTGTEWIAFRFWVRSTKPLQFFFDAVFMQDASRIRGALDRINKIYTEDRSDSLYIMTKKFMHF